MNFSNLVVQEIADRADILVIVKRRNMTPTEIMTYLDSAIRFQTPVSTDFLKEILKQFQAMHKELQRYEDDGK